jgi:beta-lactamase class A
MMSVFKLPIAATVLSLVDDHKLSLTQSITLTRADLRGGRSIIAKVFQGELMTFTLDQLLTYAVSQSDNTAADALLKVVGGPAAVMKFLQARGVQGMRVDIDERGVAQIFENVGTAPAAVANETEAARMQRLRGGYQAFLGDARNRSTPAAAADLLKKLWRNELLSRGSTQQLLNLMFAHVLPNRLRSGIPAGVRLADKSGTSDTVSGAIAAFNDIGILVWPDGHSAIIAAFLTASTATDAQRDELFANLAREVTQRLATDARQ